MGDENEDGDTINNLITIGGYQDGQFYDNDPDSSTCQTYVSGDLYSSKTLINGYLDIEKDVLCKKKFICNRDIHN